MDFSRTVVPLTNFMFRNSVLQAADVSHCPCLARTITQSTGFGAFAGRN